MRGVKTEYAPEFVEKLRQLAGEGKSWDAIGVEMGVRPRQAQELCRRLHIRRAGTHGLRLGGAGELARAIARTTTAAVIVWACAAHAAPPELGSEDYENLMPYSEWIAGRTAPGGGLCCSVSDCRVVPWRATGNGYEAMISNHDARGFVKFADAPDRYLTVPNEVIKREGNPTGFAIACWSAYRGKDNGFYCFFLPDLT